MDPIPIGYQVMGQEMQREQAGYSTDPLSTAAGDARQYAIVDLDTAPVGTKAVGVELQIAGDTHWYANDFASAGSPSSTRAVTAGPRSSSRSTGTARRSPRARVRLYPTVPAPGTPAVDHRALVPRARDEEQLHDRLPVGPRAFGGGQPVARPATGDPDVTRTASGRAVRSRRRSPPGSSRVGRPSRLPAPRRRPGDR